MDWFLELLALNSVVATGLALVVWVIARWVRSPALRHAMWVVVLAKLIVPSTLTWNVGAKPGSDSPPGEEAIPSAVLPATPVEISTLPTARGASAAKLNQIASDPVAPFAAWSALSHATWIVLGSSPVRQVLLACLLLGSLTVAVTMAWRVVRFRRQLVVAPVDADLEALVRRASKQLGLSRAPRARLVPVAIPPVLWPGRSCEVFLPATLWHSLDERERFSIVAHELAHVRRRDHWVRVLELVVTLAFWWHPVAWWARRNLRVEEERACDALVVRAMTENTRSYASALFKTLEFLAQDRRATIPSIATGADDFTAIKERMTMILRRENQPDLSRMTRLTWLVAAVLVVSVGPSWTATSTPDVPVPVPAPVAPPAPPVSGVVGAPTPPSADWLDQLTALRQEQVALEQRMLELEEARRRVELSAEVARMKIHAADVRAEVQRLRSEGESEEADLLEEEIALHLERLEFERQELEAHYRQRQVELERDAMLRELELQYQRAELDGNAQMAKELEQRLEEATRTMRRAEIQAFKEKLERQKSASRKAD